MRQSKSELNRQLSGQLSLLTMYADQYDAGQTFVAKPMATAIRVLLYDSRQSHSLLGQLGMKGMHFKSTCEPLIERPGMIHAGSFLGLVSIGAPSGYIPHLDNGPIEPRSISFRDYWAELVIDDGKGVRYSRQKLVKHLANKDGGAHIDPDLPEEYVQISRKNSTGWKVSMDNKVWEDLMGVELATVRQIGHELLRTLVPEYPIKKPAAQGLIIGGVGMFLGTSQPPVDI